MPHADECFGLITFCVGFLLGFAKDKARVKPESELEKKYKILFEEHINHMAMCSVECESEKVPLREEIIRLNNELAKRAQ